jgi:hypothetical protein
MLMRMREIQAAAQNASTAWLTLEPVQFRCGSSAGLHRTFSA